MIQRLKTHTCVGKSFQIKYYCNPVRKSSNFLRTKRTLTVNEARDNSHSACDLAFRGTLSKSIINKTFSVRALMRKINCDNGLSFSQSEHGGDGENHAN